MKYRVILMPGPREAIREHARYLAVDKQAPKNASRWLERVLAAVDALETMPYGGSIAPENVFVDYELRCRVVGRHLLLYTIIEADRVVRVVGFRHGARLPRPADLPEDPAG